MRRFEQRFERPLSFPPAAPRGHLRDLRDRIFTLPVFKPSRILRVQ